MEPILICCNVGCPQRFSCQKFARALDVNGGKIKANYQEVVCEKFSMFEK